MTSYQRSFSGPEACALAGVSYRQLDYYCRTQRLSQLVPPKGSGSQRRLSQRQVEQAWVLRQCSASPHPLPQLHVLDTLDELHGWLIVHEHGVEHVADDDELLWDIELRTSALIVNLDQCPVADRIAGREAVSA